MPASQGETEMSDVVVILEEEPGMTIQQAAQKLKELGVMVTDIDEDNEVIEATVETQRIGELKKLSFVKYVRDVFNWAKESEQEEGEVDDAGA